MRLFSDRLDAYLREFGSSNPDASLTMATGLPVEQVQARLKAPGIPKNPVDDDDFSDPPLYTSRAVPPSTSVPSFAIADIVLGLITACIVFAVYLLTLGPTVTGEDAGELITAAYTLGIPHPPGYPIWVLIAHLFTYLPLGSVAWRVALMSAVFGAIAVSLVFVLIRRIGGGRLAAMTGALALGFSAEFWEQSLIAEVYTLNLFFIAASLVLLYEWYLSGRDRYLYLFSVVYGLGLCNHNTMMLLGPAFVLYVVAVEPLFWRRWQVYAVCTALALLCLPIYLYLPIRSLANPPADWGNPETWEAFWDHVMRVQYKSGLTVHPRTLAGYAAQTGAFLELYAWEFAPWLCWLPLFGAWALWRKSRMACLLLGALALTIGPGFILILNFQIDRQSLWLNNVFWLPFYLVAAVLVGLAVGQVAAWRPGGKRWPLAVALAIAIAAVVSPLALHYERNDKKDYFFAHDFAMNTLDTLAENAIYFPGADHATFPVLYYQAVVGLRPDVTIANKYGYPEKSVYAEMPPEIREGFGKVPSRAEERFIEDWVIQNTERPVFFTSRREMFGLPEGYRLVGEGLTYRVLPPGEEHEDRDWWTQYTWHALESGSTNGELTADYILGDIHFLRGRDALVAGDNERAVSEFEQSLGTAGRNKESLNNIGSACAEHGLLDAAEGYLRETLALDPEYPMALKNLAKVYYQKKEYGLALVQFETFVKLEPEDREAVRFSAACMVEVGWYDDAVDRYQYLVNIDPENPAAWRKLGNLHLDHRRDPAMAMRCYQESLAIDPAQYDLQQKLLALRQPPAPQDEDKDDEPPLPNVDELMPSLPQIPAVSGAPQPGQVPGLPSAPQLPEF